MQRLGDGHFETIVEQLPGERVLWEGGADRRGRWIPHARVGFVTLVVGTTLVWFFGLLFLLPTPSRPRRPSTPTAATAAPSTHSDGVRQAREAKPHSWLPLLVLFGSGLLVLAITVVVEATLANQNAWYVVTNERVCIQSGVLSRLLTILDLDKVLSVRVSASWLERRRGLQSIEFLHAGNRLTASGRPLASDQLSRTS